MKERRQWTVYTDMDMDTALHIGKQDGRSYSLLYTPEQCIPGVKLSIRVSVAVFAPVKIPLTLPLSRPSLHTLILWLVVVFE